MKPRKRLRPNGPALGLIGGYGGSLALVAAAVVVLLMPLFREDGGAADGSAASGTSPSGTASAVPLPTDPAPRATPSRPGGGNAPQGQARDGGPPGPERDDGTVTWCPDGTAFYRDGGTGLEVTINVSASGLARAEASLRGRPPVSRQAGVRRPGPYTFRFGGVTARMVERVKVTTVSVGVAVQTCYARPRA